MKFLKFSENLLPLIISGEKTATWRLFDDKNLQKSDELVLVNQVDGKNFALAKIVAVTEKTLGEIRESDFAGHEKFESKEKMFEMYSSYYGDRINDGTVVKMINFKILRLLGNYISEPIKSQEELMATIRYIVVEASKMISKVIGKKLPIKSLTVFSHSQPEFDFLSEMIGGIGRPYNFNNGPRVELFEPIVIDENHITHLRIRQPDLERPQVGCNDFDTDYRKFKQDYLSQNRTGLRLIVRPEYEMIEISDSGFDVLSYVVSD